jgi:PAS domain S-box-containing protein
MVLASPEGLLSAIFASADEAIIAKNLDGTIVAWNPAAEAMYGYTAEEAIGEHVDLIIPDDRPTELSDILARIAAGEHIDHFQTVRQRKDGTRLHISVTISPVVDNGKIVGASAIARDITAEHHQAEENRRRAMIVHDEIVQGLVIAGMALDRKDNDLARQRLTSTLVAAKDVVSELLAGIELGPGDVRLD